MNTRHPLQDARIVKCLCHKQPHRWRSRFFFFLVIYLVCFARIQPVAAISGTDTITTVVGTGTAGYDGDGSAASAAQINSVRGVAFDSAGNLYLADTSNHRVRRVDAVTGVITTVAGTGTANFGGDTGPAIDAVLNTPWSLAFDSADNLYIADQSNNRIRKVDKLTGVITTFAGNGAAAFSGDNDFATKATLNAPWGITFDNADNLYIADFGNSVIRKVNTAGIITTIAGKNGSFGYGGDGLAATDPATMFKGVQDVACDAAGNVYIADSQNYRIRKVIVATGIITTVVGTGGWGGYSGDGNPASAAAIDMVSSLTFDSTGNMYFADRGNNAIRWVDMTTGIVATLAGNGIAGFSSDGTPAASAQFDSPADLAFKRNGNLYISDLKNNRIRALGPLPPTITAVTDQVIPMNMALPALPLTVGDLDTPVTSLTLSAASSNPTLVPTGNIVLGGSGAKRTVAVTPTSDLNGTAVLTLTVSDGGQTISTSFTLTVTTLQMITTVAGTGAAGYSGDGGLATAALFNEVYAVATDSAGNLYVSDSPTHRIRRVDRTTGVITTVAGDGTGGFGGDGTLATAAQMNWPRDIAFDRAGNLYIGDTMNYRVRRVDAVTGIITTVAGNGGTGGFNGDSGVATAIQLSTLRGLACDSAGNLYIADYGNQRIRRVNIASGNIATIVGTGTGGFNGDGILATTAQINNPQSLALDSADNLYFTDGGNQRVRRVDAATGIITTVAGNGVAGFSVDGGSATAAQFAQPWGIAFDRDGYLYVADGGNQRIRRVNLAAGIISTVVGTGVAGFSGDNGSATAAMIKPIWGNISFDSANNLYFTDGGNVRVRRVTPPPYVAPTITAVANQSVPMNGALTALPFTVGDMGAPATSLILSAASSNPALLPVANLRFGGNGAKRTVTLAPTLEMSGTAAITLTVSDGGLSSSTSFVLTVVPSLPMISTVAGNGTSGYSGDGGPATAAQINAVNRMATDSAGNLYIADSSNAVIRRVDKATGIITTIAGNGTSGYSGDGGPATAAQLSAPQGIAFDSAGNFYISDLYNIRRVDAVTGIITTVTGSTTGGYSGDGGPATAALINWARGIICDRADNLYIADTNNDRIRRIDAATGVITTVVGTGAGGYSGDGGAATMAQVSGPQAVALDGAGNLYIADTNNNRIRRVDRATGIITTVVGTGTLGYSGDGGLATAATIGIAYDIAVDISGNIYIPDWSYSHVRRVDVSTGMISTIVGTATSGYSGDGGLASQAQIRFVNGITLDVQRNLYILQQYDYLIRRVTHTPNTPPTIAPIAAQTIAVNTTTAPLAVTIGDDLISANSLTLSATSSNPALVPVANISFGGSGANRTVTITPTLWVSGITTINLSVSDSQLFTSASFVLTVVAASPKITSAAPPAGTYAQIYSYSFTATGVPTPSFALTVGTLPPGLTLATNGLLNGTPTASGSFAITLNATNGIQPAASASYTLVISPAPLSVTANNQSRPYGASNPVLSYSAVGFVLGDTVNVLSGTLVTTATADSPAGSYAITQGSLSAANYTLTYTPGVLTITPVGTTPCAGSTLRTLLSSQNAVIDLDGTCRYQLTETTGGNGHLINLIAHNNQTINGNGAVIEGSGVLGLLTLIDSSNVTIKHVTLTGGRATEASNTLAGRGGALLIYNSTVTFDGVQLIDNRATLGGAIATVGGSMMVINSLFVANQASEGGAAIFAQGPSTVSYSTIADSSANPNTAIFTWDSFSINSSVIANYAVALAAAGGASKPMSEEANLFAQVGQRYRTYNAGSQISIGQRSLSVDTSADQFLDMSLHDYRLQESSLAVDRTAPPTGTAALDLYGRPRPFGNSLADLGAYEFQGDHSVVALKLAPRWAATNSPFSIELQVTNRGYAPVQNLEVHDTLPSGFSLVGSLAAGGSRQGNTLIWPIATLLPNASVSLTYQVTATATTLSDGYQVLRTADQSVAASGPAVQVEVSDALVAILRNPSGRIFDPASDGFGFAAWNDRTFTYPPTEFMYRLFGSGVCTQGTESSLAACVLTATATRQSQSLQRIVNSGRTFGMAAVSFKLFRSETLADGRHLPSDFQSSATTTAQLQRDFATEQVIDTYQATRVSAGSQAPLALASDGTASDVVRVLLGSGFTGADGSEAYTLQVRQPGVGGTTLLPYALERRGESSYWLYVYDPKVPDDGQRVVSLDSAANSWAYTSVDGTSYRGDSANGSIALRRLSADTALPRTCVFCAQLQAAGTLAQTSTSIAFMLSGPGALLISDATGRVVNVDAQGMVTVNNIPGTWIDQLDPGSGTNLPPVIYVPTGSPYRVVITSTNGTNAGVALNITAPGMIAELENLPLNAVGDSLSLSVDAATSTIRFSAGSATRSAQKLSLALTAPDGKSYSCTTSGFALPSGATVNLGFDPTTNQLSLSDNAQQNLRYDMLLMRVEPGGVTQIAQRNNLSGDLGAGVTLDLSGWTGEGWPPTTIIPNRVFLPIIVR